MVAKAGMKGAAPSVAVEPVTLTKDDIQALLGVNDEQVKYLKAWNHEAYRLWSPGEQCVPIFLETAEWSEGDTIVDWGTGTGRAALKLHHEGFDVTPVDFAINCMDEQPKEVLGDKFIEHDLTQPIDLQSDYGYCCDVMEHIAPEDVDAVLRNILSNSRQVFFQISTVPDHFGHAIDEIGDHLHLTVENYSWWAQKFLDLGCVVNFSNEFENHVIFYVTAHRKFFFGRGQVNTSPEVVEENMRENAKLGLPQLKPHDEQPDLEIMLIAGGPSLNDYWDEIKERREFGMPLITVNGAYNQCIERGINPSMQFVIDAREHNKRFVEPLVEDCKYAVASQCHPELVKAVPEDRSFFWQVTTDDEWLPLLRELFGKMYEDWFPVPGGSTVTLRALCALQMLGFRKIHVYGFDSCLMGEEHHAYKQEENDNDPSIDLRIGKGTKWDKTFKVSGWHAVQAKEFQRMAPLYFQNLQLNIKGDGLIAYLVNSGAELALENEGK